MSEAFHPKIVKVTCIPDKNLRGVVMGATPNLRIPMMRSSLTEERVLRMLHSVDGILFISEGKER